MRQSTHNILPIGTAIRSAERELSDAQWADDTEATTRAETLLASLKSQQERGEQYAVPF